MRALSVGSIARDERLRGLLLELEVRLHAAAAVEQHDDRDRLDVVGEQRERLPLAVVVDREIVARQVGHETAARVGHGRVHGDRAGGGLKDGGCVCGAAETRPTDAVKSTATRPNERLMESSLAGVGSSLRC